MLPVVLQGDKHNLGINLSREELQALKPTFIRLISQSSFSRAVGNGKEAAQVRRRHHVRDVLGQRGHERVNSVVKFRVGVYASQTLTEVR